MQKAREQAEAKEKEKKGKKKEEKSGKGKKGANVEIKVKPLSSILTNQHMSRRKFKVNQFLCAKLFAFSNVGIEFDGSGIQNVADFNIYALFVILPRSSCRLLQVALSSGGSLREGLQAAP